jgi:hypothetical protein
MQQHPEVDLVEANLNREEGLACLPASHLQCVVFLRRWSHCSAG